ncbi:MAG: NAD-dependent epimerase/dehydratase family protein [Terriglobia bacterium]
MNRREFTGKALILGGAAAVGAAFPRFLPADTRPKKILVLGGTFFLGPAFVEGAVGQGHTVTLFNRGVTNPELFPHLEKLRGFRSPERNDENFSALGQRHWDAVIDVWPHDPAVVVSAAERLKDHTEHYLWVSSIAAYDEKDYAQPNLAEDAPLAPWDGAGSEYSRGKAECERRLRSLVGDKLTIVRPGPIKGIRDDTPDVLIWLYRLRDGGRHIAPGDGTDSVEIVDVKDVADFLIQAIDRSLFGTFNLTGRPMSFRDFLEGCKSATHSEAELVWIPKAFLHEQGVAPQPGVSNWVLNFPYWRPAPGMRGFAQISSEKAYQAGWITRPFRDTALDALMSFATMENFVFKDTLPAAKEEEVLKLWDSRRS